ncbi:type 4b pilus protein PilO2 [Pseudomonas alliivorans]|nr:type 4b pilus protein PilO2 [Pseudomonas alliivorans]
MLARVEIPGHGQAIAGLDWLAIQGLDSRTSEIKQLGRGADAAWRFEWPRGAAPDDNHEGLVAFVPRDFTRKKPVAAAALVHAGIAEEMFLALIDIGDSNLWVLAVANGMPSENMDRVGPASEVMVLVNDYLNTLSDPSALPIYTDMRGLVEVLSFETDIRPFSLEILGHSVNRRDVGKASFRRHTSLPIIQIVIFVCFVSALLGYFLYQQQAEETARRDAAVIKERAVAQRKLELASAVEAALNVTAPAKISIPAYMRATSNLKRSVEGWKLTRVECAGSGCTLTYEAQAFATWAGYLQAKPEAWPSPIFESDIGKVIQPIEVEMTTSDRRAAASLPEREHVKLELGTLAQVSRTLGLTVTLPTAWKKVAGNQAMSLPEEKWVPVTGEFTAIGSAVLLGDLAQRLPDVCDITSVSFKVDQPFNFELKGSVYANP